MQVFKLVDPGRVDRVIAFDTLPEKMVQGIKKMAAKGFPRAWLDFLGVNKNDETAQPFFILDFRTVNRDREKWQEIQNFVRRSTDKNFRLLDNLYDMAKPLASDSYSSLELEPEDILVIPILTIAEELEEITATPMKIEQNKRGPKPKKEIVAA